MVTSNGQQGSLLSKSEIKYDQGKFSNVDTHEERLKYSSLKGPEKQLAFII